MNHNAAPPAPTMPVSETSRQYLDSLAVIAERLHGEAPEFAGMTAFGSTTRGQAGPDSDVDIAVFMEPSDSADSLQQNSRMPKDERIRNNPYATRHEFHGGIELDYQMLVMNMLQQEGVTSADIEILPISRDIIEHSAEKLLDMAAKRDDGAAQAEQSGNASAAPIVPRNIRFLFHAPIDDAALRPYIGQTLDALRSDPHGETAWAMVRHLVVGFEQGRDGDYDANPHRYIPETLDEAVDFYGQEDLVTQR